MVSLCLKPEGFTHKYEQSLNPECICVSVCQILFVLVNVDESRNGRLMEYFRVRDFEAPLIRLVNLTDHVTYQLPSDTLNDEIIKRFCQSYLEGNTKVTLLYAPRHVTHVWGGSVSLSIMLYQPKMQSEPIPEEWDKKPVKELVGMTLEQVAFNPNKTVFVFFCKYG